MKRDFGYAVTVAFALAGMVAIWAAWTAPTLADPDGGRVSGARAPVLPLPPSVRDTGDVRQAALERMAARDMFSTGADAGLSSRRLAAANTAPPISLAPVEEEPVRPLDLPSYAPPPPSRQTIAAVPRLAEPPAPPPAQPPAQRAPVVPQAQVGPPFRLRGVYPNPVDGGRALLAMPDGKIVSIGLGGVINAFQILQIGQGSITALDMRAGTIFTLDMRTF